MIESEKYKLPMEIMKSRDRPAAMEHPRVLFVSDKAEIVGGGEISLLLLIEGLLTAGDVEPILAVPAGGELYDRARELDITIVELPQPRVKTKPWSLIRLWGDAGCTITGIDPDVVHVNSTRSMLIAGIPGSRLGIPVVWHVRVEGRDVLDPWLSRKADIIITPSRTVASRYSKSEVRVVPNPVHLATIEDTTKEIEGIRAEYAGEGEYLLLAAGQLVPKKGYLRILRALTCLDPQISWKFLLAGREGSRPTGLQARLEDYIKKEKLEERVHLLGFREDMGVLMRAADLLIHAPDSEGFGRVFIEAMAAGLPLVITPVGGLAELHEETGYGWTTEDLSPESLARAIELALNDRDTRSTFRGDGPRLARELFSVEKHAGRVREIYREILAPEEGAQGRPV